MYIEKLKRNLRLLIKFSIVGGFGTIINMSIFWLLAIKNSLNINLSSLFAFIVAVTNNYIFNHLWSFREQTRLSIKKYSYYVVANIQGLSINLIFLNFFVFLYGSHYSVIGQMIGISFGMISNFLLSKYLIFKNRLR
jgi:dolichol-phosphate mannosyltransferase